MLLAPSILSLDYAKFNEQLAILNEKVEMIHFDVMDGHFVPNISFGPDIFKAFRKNSDLFMDVHLMVTDPEKFADVFIKAGADNITFHYEVFEDLDKCRELIHKIKDNYVKVGLSIKPGTDVETIKPLLDELDIILVMSVEPGFGGQKFMESAYDKLRELKDYRDAHGLNYKIEVDGGVKKFNARQIVEAGCDILVAGSFVFEGDMRANIDSITF
ncbi:MAG: ribulose-phosphate 3-epimerase [Erysipelotrichaceae bacterium]|nr:ribulose-phosphate 3-epimerase [Erysipelotrichaceae bacterium]